MAGKLTGGRVLFGRTVNLGDYNSKKAEAEFTFEADGADAVKLSDSAAAHALDKVNELLSGGEVKAAAKAAPKATPAGDPATVTDTETVAAKPKAAPSAAEVTEDDDFSKVAVKQISDQELQDAMAKKKQALSHFLSPPEPTKRIKTLAAKFVKAGSTQLSDMPQEVRVQFLAELEALKP